MMPGDLVPVNHWLQPSWGFHQAEQGICSTWMFHSGCDEAEDHEKES